MNKKGISLISILIYVILFFTFSVITVSVTTNMNMKTLSERGRIYISEEIQKLQSNLIDSAKNSDDFDYFENSIVFSNDDDYEYDSDKKIIKKNGGILINDVSNFERIELSELSGINDLLIDNLDENKKYICVKVDFTKYSKNYSYDLLITLGDDIVE